MSRICTKSSTCGECNRRGMRTTPVAALSLLTHTAVILIVPFTRMFPSGYVEVIIRANFPHSPFDCRPGLQISTLFCRKTSDQWDFANTPDPLLS